MKYEITKEQIETIYAYGCIYIKEWFPEAFKTVLKVGKWYKSINGVLKFFESNETAYGFNSEKQWSDLSDNYDLNNLDKSRVGYDFKWEEATKSEVFEALKNEAVERGYCKQNTFVKSLLTKEREFNLSKSGYIEDGYEYTYNKQFLFNGVTIFKEGQWAEIIPTITKSEAEKLLNKKII